MAESCGPYLCALSYNSKRGTASNFIFFGTERTSFLDKGVKWKRKQTIVVFKYRFNRHLLFSGKFTKKIFFCSFGFVTCAGIYGYYVANENTGYIYDIVPDSP